MRIDELRAKRQGGATSATVSERFASAQRHLAASQAAAEQAIACAVRALRRAAEAHERVALLHERAAATGAGDKDEHERQAAIHQAAAGADTQRAEHLVTPGHPFPADSNGDSNSSDHRPPAATGTSA